MLIQSRFFGPHSENLSYSDFKRLVGKGKVSELTIDARTISYGMSDAIGLATVDRLPAAFLPMPVGDSAAGCSEETSRLIDHEARQTLEARRERVRRDLTAHRATLDALAGLLIERQVVDRATLDRAAGHPGVMSATTGTRDDVGRPRRIELPRIRSVE